MNDKQPIRVVGVLVGSPFPYRSVEEPDEIFLAKFQPTTAAQLPEEAKELYLNFGSVQPDVQDGDKVKAAGTLAPRQIVTRSGKMRRAGTFQLIVHEWSR
jgi:hypothetical protein